MYYVYILLSLKDKNFYTGSTGDLKSRLNKHNTGNVKSTMHRRPFRLLCYEAYNFKVEAQAREKYLKSSDGKKDLRRRLTKSLDL